MKITVIISIMDCCYVQDYIIGSMLDQQQPLSRNIWWHTQTLIVGGNLGRNQNLLFYYSVQLLMACASEYTTL